MGLQCKHSLDMMKTKNSQSTSRPATSTSSATVAAKANRSRNPLKSSESQGPILSSPFKISTTTSSKLRAQRYSHGLGILNLKFGPNSVARFGSSEKRSEFTPDIVATVYGSLGPWKISSTINKEWWEIYEHPQNDAVFAVLWITPFVGIILDQCAKNKERVKTMIARLDELASLYRTASQSIISPDHIEDINPPTAGAGIRRSIQQLSNEAKFLQKDISGAEVIDCITRTRSLVERAARIHQDTLPQIFAAARRTAESRKQAEGKGKQGIHFASCKVHVGPSGVHNVSKPVNGVPPHKGEIRSHAGRGKLGRAVLPVPSKDARQPKVGKGK